MTKKKPESLPVIFRAERSGDHKGEVTAVFPTLPGTNDPNSFTIYAHVGQHGTGSPGWYYRTRAAKPDEYASLLRELRGIYESDNFGEAVTLKIAHKFTRHHDAARDRTRRNVDLIIDGILAEERVATDR